MAEMAATDADFTGEVTLHLYADVVIELKREGGESLSVAMDQASS